MVARSILLRHLRRQSTLTYRLRGLATTPKRNADAKQPTSTPQPPTPTTPTTQEKKSWLTKQVESSPTAKKVFLGFTNLLGYGSTTQVAGRRAYSIYNEICAVRPDEDKDFWQNDCFLPPTFQSWFTITSLHLWMLTVRLRALPPEYGKAYQQAVIDHFFMDIEDRIRNVLQPPAEPTKPYTFESPFYVNPNAYDPKATLPNGKPKPRTRAPDRIVKRQMNIFKEQWAGMGFSFDLGLVKSDMELAAAVWRNMLGARGAQGITYPDASSSSSSSTYRRAVNLVGGEVVDVAKIDLEKEEVKDDGSGVHDFPPTEVDKYLTYPSVMLDIVRYVRRELSRLEKVSDEEIISGDWRKLKFGSVTQE